MSLLGYRLFSLTHSNICLMASRPFSSRSAVRADLALNNPAKIQVLTKLISLFQRRTVDPEASLVDGEGSADDGDSGIVLSSDLASTALL